MALPVGTRGEGSAWTGHTALLDLNVADTDHIACCTWGAIESATRRIEAGSPAAERIHPAIHFAFAGVALVR